ncbi:putative Methionine--tRNA ligase [Cocos nucifera]|uniref:Putative Methionine--tRNA ligase n=1 Tax=Cocos nucifera TaxID=13894 RepID=A0A8K0N1L7_COCNU|nr:putative Methionine--tRNA ligase [Cocos nucifera]
MDHTPRVSMAKLAQQLKDGFLNLVERVKKFGGGSSQANGTKEADFSGLRSSQDGGVHAAKARGPNPPSVSKGPPPQHN